MRRTIASQRLHFTYFRLIIARFLRYVNRMSAFTTFLSVIFLEFLLGFMVFRYRFIINWCQVVVSHRHRKELLSCPKEANIFTNEKMDVGKHVIPRIRGFHSDLRCTGLLGNYRLSFPQQYRRNRFQLFGQYRCGRIVHPADPTNLCYPNQRK